MKKVNVKKLVIPNIPYFFLGLYATKLGQAWRLAPGAGLSEKLLRIMDGMVLAFQSAAPSFHPVDLLYGVICRTKSVKDVYRDLEKSGELIVHRNPSITPTGRPATYFADEKGKQTELRWRG